jgi:hypothetical protein
MIVDTIEDVELACLFQERARLTESMRIAAFLMLGLLLFAGCGERLPVAPVSGTITLDDKPLAGASITTQPIGTGSQNPGPGSFGRTDDQGRFELELVKPAMEGAIIGEHRVMISRTSDDKSGKQLHRSADGEFEYSVDDPQAHRAMASGKWPVRYTDGSLSLQVPSEGTDKANFDLTAKP